MGKRIGNHKIATMERAMAATLFSDKGDEALHVLIALVGAALLVIAMAITAFLVKFAN